MVNIASEDTMVLIATTPSNTDFGPLSKIVVDFFALKQDIDNSDRFNLCAFQNRGPVYLEDFTFNLQYFTKLLRGLDARLVPDPDVIGGIIVAVTFMIDVFKKVGGKTFRLVVLTDRGTPAMDGSKVEITNTLVDQVKELPFILDIVRIGVKDELEDMRLDRLAKRAGGGIYYARSLKDLIPVMERLSKKKDLGYLDGPGTDHFKVSPLTEAFFANCAAKPMPVKAGGNGTKCQVCFEVVNEKSGSAQVVKCPCCGTAVHPECWAQWAESSNIGVPYLFRCHQCFNLLRLDPEFVADVILGGMKNLVIQARNQEQVLRARDQQGLRVVVGQNPFGGSSEPLEEAKEYGSCKDDDDNSLMLIWCPKCNAMLPPGAKFCNKCGAKV
jgi:hypothetical protein